MAITFAAGALIDRSGDVTVFDTVTGSTALWFRRNGRPGGNPPVIQAKYSSAGSGAGIGVYFDNTGGTDDGRVGIQIKNGSGGQVNLIQTTPKTSFDGNWHLVSMNWSQSSGAACNLYYDGVNKASANNSGAWAWTLQGIRYARSSDGFWGSWDGQLAHGCWWNEPLTDMEHYLLGCGIAPSLIRPGAITMYLPMDDPATPLDYSSNRLTVTTSGTLTRSVYEPILGPADQGFLFDKFGNASHAAGAGATRKFKVFRTARI